jgi:hypothetical protein
MKPFLRSLAKLPGSVIALLFLLAPLQAFAAENAPARAVVREYCTNVGPISLTFDGERVTGRYRISVKTPADEGTIEGVVKDGLLEATWTEAHSGGRIIFGFSSDFSQLHAIYNSRTNPSHWFGRWYGVNKNNLETVPQAERRDLYCDWR